jgi:hypothetical protein
MEYDLISRKALKAEIKAWVLDALDLRTISQLIDSAPAAETVSREEYDALLKRFRHLMESEYIASFDKVNRRTGAYLRDIHEADFHNNTI